MGEAAAEIATTAAAATKLTPVRVMVAVKLEVSNARLALPIRQWRRHGYSLRENYQRSTRGPSERAQPGGRHDGNEYQVGTKIAETSAQWTQ